MQSYFTNPKPDISMSINPSEQYYRATSFTELNKSRDFGNTRQRDYNDNTSVHSKISTTSRNQLLRPVSINNDDHLFNLTNKEDRLKASNLELINNFVKNMNTTKFNVITNMGQSFKQRISEIWASYLSEQQKNPNLKINPQDLENDIATIKSHFQENLSAKTALYIEELKKSTYEEAYRSLEEKNNIKHYLDNDVKQLMETDFNNVQTRNLTLKKEVEETKVKYQAMIDQTADKYQRLREAHMEVYDREFCFKLNGDDKLTRDTLMNALPFLQSKNRKLDEKLNYIKAKGDARAINQLKSEIAALEARLK